MFAETYKYKSPFFNERLSTTFCSSWFPKYPVLVLAMIYYDSMYLDHKSSPKRSIIDSEEEQIQAKEERDDTFKQDEVPEGGFGWFVVLGAFISQFMTFGISTAW